MKNFRFVFFLGIISVLPFCTLKGQENFNYDEEKVGAYKLPPLLQLPNGQKITSAKQWTQEQRPALLKLFAEHVYGKFPGKPTGLHFQVTEEDNNALGGKAIRKQVTIFFTQDKAGPSMDVLLYLPKAAKGPVPVFAGLNFKGNHTVNTDPKIKLTSRWVGNDKSVGIENNKTNEASRGMQASRWLAEEIITRGYGLATVYYGDLEPDHPKGWQTGIRTTMQAELNTKPTEWGAIGAWAWGLSRMQDYFETDKAINAKQVVLVGHSRIGKATLWAGANDTRFAMIVSNESGEGGAALARRWYGETVARINTSFPHWFVAKYKAYNQNPSQLPVDQHMLLALVAPRPLYVASAEEDTWSDPKGEFLGAKLTEPVYALFKKKGLGVTDMPAVNQPVGETIRYHNRSGKHDVTAYDWQQYLKFAEDYFRKK